MSVACEGIGCTTKSHNAFCVLHDIRAYHSRCFTKDTLWCIPSYFPWAWFEIQEFKNEALWTNYSIWCPHYYHMHLLSQITKLQPKIENLASVLLHFLFCSYMTPFHKIWIVNKIYIGQGDSLMRAQVIESMSLHSQASGKNPHTSLFNAWFMASSHADYPIRLSLEQYCVPWMLLLANAFFTKMCLLSQGQVEWNFCSK